MTLNMTLNSASAFFESPTKHLQGLNSIELLYKVLIHYKEDQPSELGDEEAADQALATQEANGTAGGSS